MEEPVDGILPPIPLIPHLEPVHALTYTHMHVHVCTHTHTHAYPHTRCLGPESSVVSSCSVSLPDLDSGRSSYFHIHYSLLKAGWVAFWSLKPNDFYLRNKAFSVLKRHF